MPEFLHPERIEPLDEFLRACARVELDDEDRARIVDAAARVKDWSLAAPSADYHGLAPLVWHYTRACGVELAAGARKQLGAILLRQRDLSRAQADALDEIVDAIDAAGIEHVLLKGAALAHVLYPRPDLRPMCDLDILVASADTGRFLAIMKQLGFEAPSSHARRALRLHHHLPMSTRERDGVVVGVEIHTDALSRDHPITLRLGSLSQPAREFVVRSRRLRSLGHVDMLLLLSRHVLEPRERTRLIHVADLVGYAARYANEIDWELLQRRHPRVLNALALMHYVTPLPQSLRRLCPSELVSPPRGVARGFTPLSSVGALEGGVGRALGNLLYPPEWWMRVYYGVPPHRSLFSVRWGRHLWRVVYWLGRRVVASAIPRQRDTPVVRAE